MVWECRSGGTKFVHWLGVMGGAAGRAVLCGGLSMSLGVLLTALWASIRKRVWGGRLGRH
jgi:hypothetical protein